MLSSRVTKGGNSAHANSLVVGFDSDKRDVVGGKGALLLPPHDEKEVLDSNFSK